MTLTRAILPRARLIGGRRAVMALTAMLGAASCASTQQAPPEAVAPYLIRLGRYQEPPIWAGEAREGYRTRLRLTMYGIVAEEAVIRIDERANGDLRGRIVFMRRNRDNGRALPATLRRRHFRVTRADWEALGAAIARARMFRLFPEFWVDADPEALCVDGMILLFERGDTSGYRFSHANAQCTAPPEVREVARQMIEMSGERRLRLWIS